jgi:hypothetical protein
MDKRRKPPTRWVDGLQVQQKVERKGVEPSTSALRRALIDISPYFLVDFDT